MGISWPLCHPHCTLAPTLLLMLFLLLSLTQLQPGVTQGPCHPKWHIVHAACCADQPLDVVNTHEGCRLASTSSTSCCIGIAAWLLGASRRWL